MGWIWILLLGLAFYLVYLNNNSGHGKIGGPGELPESPLEILKKRYARGEITREQFEEIKHDLQ